MVRVYAVCRKCAEVHLAEGGCPRCARRSLLASPSGASTLAVSTAAEVVTPSGARAEPTSLAASPRAPMWRLSTAVVGAYLLVVLGLLAAVLLDI